MVLQEEDLAGTTAPVPLVDLGRQHALVADEIAAGWARIVEQGSFVGGAEVEALEEELAGELGVRRCVAVGNGTDALELLLRATGIPRGTEVVLPANTFVATAEAVLRAGCRVRLVDCEPGTKLIDVDQVASTLRERNVSAVLVVHLYGQAGAADDIRALCEGRPVVVLEDAAEAPGARRSGRPVGTLGLGAGLSFYPGENLGAYGDGGAVLTEYDGIADTVKLLRDHGSATPDRHEIVGCNSRLDSLQAVVLRAKLRRLAAWNAERAAAAAIYDELLSGTRSLHLPMTAPGNEHVWHRYVVEVDDRERVLAALDAAGIVAGVHHPVPIHLHRAYRWLGQRAGSFPVAEAAAARVLSLPLFPGITLGEQERVATALQRAIA